MDGGRSLLQRPGATIVRASGRVVSIFALLFLLIYFSSYCEGILRNAGAILLNRALSSEGAPSEREAAAAEATLALSADWTAADRATWRLIGFARAAQGNETEAARAWLRAGDMADEFVNFGRRGRAAGEIHEGVTLREAGRPVEALEAHRRALSAPLVEVGISDVYFEMGRIEAVELESPDLKAARDALDVALAENQFKEASKTAAYYYRAEVLRWTGMVDRAIVDYRRALSEEPDHYLANLRLGAILWEEQGEVEEAERLLMRAISVDPDVKWAYRSLAELYQETGREAEALFLYKRVLELDSQDSLARAQIERLGNGNGQ